MPGFDSGFMRGLSSVGEKMLVFDWEPSPKMKEAFLKAVELDL
jgi:hypothetical protein